MTQALPDATEYCFECNAYHVGADHLDMYHVSVDGYGGEMVRAESHQHAAELSNLGSSRVIVHLPGGETKTFDIIVQAVEVDR